MSNCSKICALAILLFICGCGLMNTVKSNPSDAAVYIREHGVESDFRYRGTAPFSTAFGYLGTTTAYVVWEDGTKSKIKENHVGRLGGAYRFYFDKHLDAAEEPEPHVVSSDIKEITSLKKTLSLKHLPELEGRRPAIAIPDMFSHQLSPGEVGVLSDSVRNFMVETGYFKVLSNQDMKSILEAQDFSFSDRCDDAVCLVKIGKMLHVEKVIGGTVDQLGKRFSISLRLVDVESGEIEHTVQYSMECPVEQLLDVAQMLASELAEKYATTRMEEGSEG